MATARDVALALSKRFLETGSYAQAPTKFGPTEVQAMVPASARAQAINVPENGGFAGLAVQSVGYAETPDNKRVYVYVTKGAKKQLAALSTDIEDVHVLGRRMGNLLVRPELAATSTGRGNVFERRRNLACGSSCAPTGEDATGTLGALVKKGRGANELFFLSNNHVFGACNHTPVGQHIISPSNLDSRPGGRALATVAEHAEVTELRSGDPKLVPPCELDVAIARVSQPTSVSSWQGDTDGYDTPTTVVEPQAEMRVKKVGRTTGLTLGVIESRVETPSPIPYKSTHFTSRVWFKDMWTVRVQDGDHFALGGDSGSLVVTEDGRAAVGLLFLASPHGEYGWIMPISRALASCGGLTLVGQHNV